MSIAIDFQNRDALELSQFADIESTSWLKPAREKALNAFKQAKLPNRKVEHWKYNETAFLKEAAFYLIEPASAERQSDIIECSTKLSQQTSAELIIVDGYLVSDLKNFQNLDSIRITSFEDANESQRQIILSHFEGQTNNKNLLLDLNESVNNNGVLIEIAKNQNVEQPIYIRYLTSEHEQNSLTSQKTIVHLAAGAQATLIEQFSDQIQTGEQLALQQTSIMLEDNSQLQHYRLNLDSANSRQVSQVKTHLGRNAVSNSFYIGFGSRLSRTDIDVMHIGENAECQMTGIYLPAGKQQIDYHTNIEHQVPHCRTQEVFRGIIADQASATFNGKIHIFQGAQKSDAQLNNKNLLLTNQAEVNTKPELEIYADDVKCAHGATVAQLDEMSLYYLQSRGINRQKAKKMLSVAFVQELLNQVGLESVKQCISDRIDQYMSNIA